MKIYIAANTSPKVTYRKDLEYAGYDARHIQHTVD